MSLASTIAEAVKSELTAAASDPSRFGETFTARRVFQPQYDLSDLSDLRVTVIPSGQEREISSRTSIQNEISVDVGVQKRLPAIDPTTEDGNDWLDGMLSLAEAVADFYDTDNDVGTDGVYWIRTDNEPIYDPASLIEQRVFATVITFTFRKIV